MVSYTSKTFTLHTGAKMPAVGLGTWKSKPDEVRDAVAAALKAGYRHIDTAAAYGNEKEVGEGIRASGVPRDQIWITTKLDNPYHKTVAEALDKSLEKLGVDYVDLYLMHWPVNCDPNDNKKPLDKDWDYVMTWKEMEKLDRNKALNIGVSNFGIRHLERILSETSTVPAVNQIELHPCNPTPKLVAFCADHKIQCTGYSCLGSTDSPLPGHAVIKDVCEKTGKTPAQVLLVWGLKKGWCVIPKSVTPERIRSNFELDGWDLGAEEMEKLDGIKETFKVCKDGWLWDKVFFEGDNIST